jgi:hypothetical protein
MSSAGDDGCGYESKWLWSSCRACCRLGLALVACLVIAGCGGASSSEHLSETYLTRPNDVRYEPNGLQTIVRKPIPGGDVAIIAKRYEYRGHVYSELNHREESSSQPGRGAGGGGVDIEAGQHRPLEIDVSRGCLGGHAYAVAYGILREPKDSVTSQTDGRRTRLKAVVIPTNFHPDGVLIYEMFGRDATDVVVRTPKGRIVSNEFYAGRDAIACHDE